MTLQHLYTDTVDILTPTSSVTVTGSVIEGWATSVASVACEIQPVSQGYVLTEKGYVKGATHRGFFELSTPISRGDRVRMNSSYPPTLFDVTAVKEIRYHHLEVDLIEVNEADSSSPGGVS